MTDPATILVVDDDPAALGLAVQVLTATGYRVLVADSGELALQSLTSTSPDLVILDVRLQGIDGFEVCRQMSTRPETQDTPIILISAFLSHEEWAKGLEAGAADFIAKPYANAELVARVKTHLRLVRTLDDLKEKELQYRNLADSGLALIWRSGIDKKCYYFNKPWLEFTGRTLEQEDGDGWAEGVHPEDLDRCFKTYVEAFDRREAFEMQYRLRHHSGEYRWILDMGTPNHDSRGEFVGYIGHCFDITEKIKQQESLQRNDRLDALGILAGGIAHDFNNLLAGLFAYLSMAKTDVAAGSPAARHLEKALGAFERAKDLTRQLLTFSKGGDPIRTTGDLGQRVRECVNFALSGSTAACEFQIAPDLRPCEFDANQIGQVIDNLIINAQQAMPEGGKITVRVRNLDLKPDERPGLPAGPYLLVSISDTGSGIPAAILPRIYDPFFTTKPKGNGLGLPTCYSILQKHQGGIDVETEQGKGTTFHIFLPAAKHPSPAKVPASLIEHRGTGTFLVLDDEDLLRELGAEWLESFGYSVATFCDGTEVLPQLAQWKGQKIAPVAALLDLTVPGGKGGKEIVGPLASAFPGLKIFATSGYSEDPIMAHPKNFGFTDSLRKPYLKEELIDLLNRYLP